MVDSKQPAAPEPCVGIFWSFEGRLIIDSTPLSAAELYGETLTHPAGHIDHWTALQQRGAVPRDVEYEEPPRGRVVYSKRDERFLLWADRCIANRSDLVNEIMGALRLPLDRTSKGLDEHYRCAACLSSSRRGQT